MNDKAILGSLVHAITKQCRVCGCEGDSCSLETGEKCVLASRSGLCTNPKCISTDYWKSRHSKRNRAREVRAKKQGRVA